jgi:peptidoglycan/xylan/chitin deacetylase (PgdA/CDA1 family)|tara:strand:+ start:1507 stop:2355 length:849 start_codon:yes stop_codon:yes gene_type:complete
MKNTNILSIDIESFIHGDENLSKSLSCEQKKILDNGHTERAVRYILKLLKKYDATATFFIIGEVYEWNPGLIDTIEKEGHEIGFHSHNHKLLKNADILRQQITYSKNFIKKFRPKGFRAPLIYLKKEYLKILKRNKFIYDSSVYNSSGHIEKIGGILEFPVSSFKFLGKQESKIYFPKNLNLRLLTQEIPFGSGYFIGLFKKNIRIFLEYFHRKNKVPVLFFHPWQLLPKPKNNGFLNFNYLVKHPKLIPYTFNVNNTFIYLLKNYKNISLEDYLIKEGILK